MAGPHTGHDLAAVRADVNRACALLVAASPDALDACAAALTAATTRLRDGVAPAAKEQATGLRRDIRRARTLLEAAAAFYGNWSRRLGALTGGYRCDGQPAEVERRRSWSLEA
jgi:hypothetical protein